MHTFEDAKGRTWSIDISTIELAAIRKATDFRLTDIFDAKLAGLTRLSSDYELLVDCVWLCVKPQADAEGVDVEDFVRAINGDALLAAQEALVKATVDFFPHQETRNVCRKLWSYLRAETNSTLTTQEAMVSKVLANGSIGTSGS